MPFKPAIFYLLELWLSVVSSQSIYINVIPEYSSLAPCAQFPISTIVRDMVNGCGDNKAVTSYSCFCTASSSYYSAFISSNVLAQCPGNSSAAQALSAVEVFHSYCEVGTVNPQSRPASETQSTQPTGSSNGSASPAYTLTSSQATSTTSMTVPPPGNTSEASLLQPPYAMMLLVGWALLGVAYLD